MLSNQSLEIATYTRIDTQGDKQTCFTQSLMWDIIFAVLTDRIAEESETSSAIKKNLLPIIFEQLQEKKNVVLGFNYQEQTLKKSITDLISYYSSYSSSNSSEPFNVNSLIDGCNFNSLFAEICLPALQQLKVDAMRQHQDLIMEEFKKLMTNEFLAFIKKEYKNELAFDLNSDKDKDIIAAAESQHRNGEFYFVDEKLKKNLLNNWKQTFEINKDSFPTDSNQRDNWITGLFENWWNHHNNSNKLYETYLKFHESSTAWVGTPQYIALGQSLNCNLKLVGSDGNTTNLYGVKESNKWNDLHVKFSSDHFDAMLPGQTEVAQSLKKASQAKKNNSKAFVVDEQVIKHIQDQASEIADISKQIKKENISLSETQLAFISAAEGGYKDAFKHTTFYKVGNGVKDLNALLTDLSQNHVSLDQTDKDFLFAVQEQNDEIIKSFKR